VSVSPPLCHLEFEVVSLDLATELKPFFVCAAWTTWQQDRIFMSEMISALPNFRRLREVGLLILE